MSARSENYRLLQDQSLRESKESLDVIDSFQVDMGSNASPPFLKASAMRSNVVVLLFIVSTIANVSLAIMLSVSFIYLRSHSREILNSEPANITPYGQATFKNYNGDFAS